MTLEALVALFIGIAVGAAVALLAGRRRRKQEVVAAALVPHRTRQVLAAMQSGTIIVRRDGRAAFSNAYSTTLGVARPDGAVHERVVALAEEAWERGEPREAEIEIKRGVLAAIKQIRVRITPLDEHLAFAVVNDRTHEHSAEITRREFAVNVSHELKTPIGALSLLAESVEAAADDPEAVRHFSGQMSKETRRLTKLIKEIIEISRLQGGASVDDHAVVSLRSVVEEVVDEAKVAADTRGIDLTVSETQAAEVIGDRDLLAMAVRNLVDNAIAYSDEGGKVSVSTSVEDGVASVKVIDRGIGIAEDQQDRIFERFFRTDPARSRLSGGTGLGLSIVKHIAAQHAGEVTLWSKLGVGSTFTLRVPVHEEMESQ